MQNIKEKLTDLNDLILQGKALEAFDKYYHTDVVMQENHGEPTIGKAANRVREEAFFGAITEFRGASVLALVVAEAPAAGEHISYVTWKFDYTHQEWGPRDYTQVAVQTWKDGLIVKEQFIYGN